MKVCAIVDASSSGNLLAPAFIKRGYKVIHIWSKEYSFPLIKHSFHSKDFYLHIAAADADTQATILRDNKVEFIIAGAEHGVERADILNEKLGLPGNDTALSLARRNKYEMIDVINKAGLKTARQTKATMVEQALDFASTLPSYDVILKPQRSSGSNLVFRARNQAQVSHAFVQIMSHRTMFEEVNVEVCVQEYLKGTEYIVDTVSRNGLHVITDIWRYHFTNANGVPFLYDYTELLDYNDRHVASLKQYTLSAIDALGIKWGPAHPEIMLTRDGPVAIEVGARLAGAKFPLYAGAATGQGAVEITADAYCAPKVFEQVHHNPYILKTNCVLVSLIAPYSGVLKSLAQLETVKALRSFYSADIWVREGQKISRTIDVATGPGIIALMHSDMSVIQADYATIRRLERNGLYELHT